jgi:hypothetical protein
VFGPWVAVRVSVANLVVAVVLQAEKVAKKMKGNAVSGYSNDSNPFGDPNLTEKYANSFPTSDTLSIALSDTRLG